MSSLAPPYPQDSALTQGRPPPLTFVGTPAALALLGFKSILWVPVHLAAWPLGGFKVLLAEVCRLASAESQGTRAIQVPGAALLPASSGPAWRWQASRPWPLEEENWVQMLALSFARCVALGR